jgi:hypothetical protein
MWAFVAALSIALGVLGLMMGAVGALAYWYHLECVRMQARVKGMETTLDMNHNKLCATLKDLESTRALLVAAHAEVEARRNDKREDLEQVLLETEGLRGRQAKET